jgi:alpha-L-fucosidase
MRASTRRSLCLIVVLLALFKSTPIWPRTISSVPVPTATETKAQRDKRMAWWREARFGMFIHWGLYAIPAGEWKGKTIGGASEWIMNSAKIPVADYAALAPQFNPVKFDADAWAQLAKDAGMKYVVFTSKHHDGFAMFPSQASAFNIYSATPFKRDPLGELAAACRKRGLKFGVYYSQAQDWHHPGGAAYGNHWDKAQDGDLHQYVRAVAAPQVRELLARYKPSVLWWDTPVDMSPADVAALTAGFVKHSSLITNNRLGNGVPGDTETPSRPFPPQV